MLLSYNTNGLTNHDLLIAIDLLAEIGYDGVSITLDHQALNPYHDLAAVQLVQVGAKLQKHRLRCAIETGARYLLDPRNKHEPTLVSPDPAHRARRIDFLLQAIDIAASLNADCVSIWSGVVRDGAGRQATFQRLVESLPPVLDRARQKNVILAFEPEPGMLVDRLDRYEELLDTLTAKNISTSHLRLTLDVGHLHCQGELPIEGKIRQYARQIANIHIEDMRSGVHEHLMFGEGEIDFSPVIAALAQIGYDGLVSVELSRHSHIGPEAARRAYNYLRPLLDTAAGA